MIKLIFLRNLNFSKLVFVLIYPFYNMLCVFSYNSCLTEFPRGRLAQLTEPLLPCSSPSLRNLSALVLPLVFPQVISGLVDSI